MRIKYIHRQGVPFLYYNNRSYSTITVLSELTGQPFNEIVLGYIQGLRPSLLRVIDINDCITCDARLHRITVFLEKGLIKRIEQEVEVGLPDGIENAYELGIEKRKNDNNRVN